MPLLRLTEPRNQESMAGFICRLSDLNHYPTPGFLYRAIFGSYPSYNPNLFDTREGLDKLSVLSGVKIDTLLKLIFMRAEDGRQYSVSVGQALRPYAFCKQGAKVCPSCLAKDGYFRLLWDISFVTECPIHKCLLMDSCPECGSKIHWIKPKLLKCSCGADLSGITAALIPKEKVGLSKWITYLVTGMPLEVKTMLSPELRALELSDLVQLMAFFIGQIEGITDSTGKFLAIQENNAVMHNLLQKAQELFLDWPNNYHAFLDKMSRRPKCQTGADTGIKRDFGRFYETLYEKFGGSQFDFLREAFEQYLSTWDGGYISSKHRMVIKTQIYLCANDASKILHTNTDRIKELVRQEILTGTVRKMGERQMVLVQEDSLQRLKSELEDSYTLKQAGTVLGIGHEAVLDLVNCHFLKALSGPGIDGYSFWVIQKRSVIDLLAFIGAKVVKSSDAESVSFYKLVRILSPAGVTLSEVMGKILEGTLTPVTISEGVGLKQFCFSAVELRKILDEKLVGRKGELLSTRDAALCLGVKQEVAAFWFDKGFIKGHLIDGAKKKRLIPKDEIEKFHREFVLPATIAKNLGISPKALVDELNGIGIMPISGPCVDGCRQYLFLGEDMVTSEPADKTHVYGLRLH